MKILQDWPVLDMDYVSDIVVEENSTLVLEDYFPKAKILIEYQKKALLPPPGNKYTGMNVLT